MSKKSTWLLDHKRDIHSQTGEDGIIEKILEVLPQNDKWCVEFGAWDGLFLTNTRYLIESKDTSAVLIEADKNRFSQLKSNYLEHDNVTVINQFVGFKENDNLDHILNTTATPEDFDFLSIDIDGNDFHVWKSMERYKPKVVVIEFNPTIPTHIKFVQPADPALNQGASLLSLVELGREKGYELVSVLPWNAFFVRKEYYHLFQIESNAPEVLRTNLDKITYLFSGYDGRLFFQGSCQLPWHNIELEESKLQVLPRYLRKYSGNYTLFQKIAFVLYLAVTNPSSLMKMVRKQ